MLFKHEFFHGRSYGRMRVFRGEMSAARLALMRTAGVLLPVWLPVKTVARIARRGRYLAQMIVSLPLLALAAGAWGLGELAGYWSEERE